MEDSATITECLLLSELQSSSDLSSIYHLFSSYLHPFTAIINKPKKQSKPSEINAKASTIIHSLAKKFTSFLNKALNLIPKRLNETPKIESCYASELFEAYKLCLSCLESIMSALSCKPHYVQFQRLRLIHCYQVWGRYEDAQNEGFSLLEYIWKLWGERGGNLKREVIPQLTKENGDKDVAMLILDVVVTHCNCVLNGRSKDNEVYRRLLSMVDEVQPWWRFVEGYAYEKLHKLLVTYLTKCTLFLVGELAIFEGSLVQNFCVLTLSEITKLSANDQMEKFGRMICNSVFSQLNDHLLCSVEILTCVLDYMAHECKNGMDKSLVDFLKLVDYCAIKCRNATVDIGGAVATHFNKLAAELSQVTALPIDLIMRLYAITLSVTDLNGGNTKKKIAGSLLKMEDQLQDLTAKLGSLTCQCRITEMTNLPLLFKALRFLCGPLSKLVISERKDILCGLEDVSFSIKLPNIQDAFHQFGLVFLAYRAYERERDVYEDNMQTVLNVAAAAFTLSLATKENVKESTTFLLQLISADWVQANGLKFLFPNLHNVGIMLYKINRLKEAAKSVKLCRQAAWNRVLLFCKTFSSSSKDAFSSDTIAGFVTEACEESASLLDILHLSGSNKTSKILTDSLESWSIAHSLFHKIPFPMVLIEQWVKIVCEEMKDSIAGRTIPTIYSLMSSFNMSKETLGILLEEELQAYKELKYLNPTLCKTMQMSITDILLEEIYTRKDSYLQRSRILLAKERESRAYGVDGLNDCIKYLSEAISIMQSIYKSNDGSGPVCCLLAEAYCLRALCTQEAEPNSKHFIEDVGNALKLWLSQEHEQTRNTLTLLYYVADMLSLKGYMEHHSDIYETMIKSFMWKNIPLQECLIMLWQSRSLSHALCASTVSDEFIMTFSKHCKLSKSVEFWISCLERSKSLEVGFRQSLSVISTLSSPDSDRHNHITIHEAKQVAYDLISKVPLSSNSLFLAAHLYYDLGETLIAKGSMIEALYYAKEAHRLRAKLFLKNFRCLIELQNDIVGATAETVQKCRYDPKSFHMHRAMATAAWSYDKRPGDFEGSILTPWNVLKVYLESTLQVGTIQEIVGNGSEAKTLLLWGKNISSIQDLPIFVVGFSCALGKLYREQKLWHLAERELEAAKHILADSSSLISCLKCRLVMEVTVDQQLGDLFQSRFSSTSDDRLLFKAETFYRCATDKLNVSAWKNCVSAPEEANTMLCDALLISGQETIQQPKVTRKSKKITQRMTCRTITTRSRSRKQRDEYCIPTCGCEGTCEVECWHCLPCQLIKSMSLTSIIQMKWECIRRRLLLRLLIGKGKCLGVGGEIQRSHQVLLESLSVLVSRSTFRTSCFSVSIPLLVELIEKKVIAEVFALEHASILYNICWFSLGTRNDAIPVPIVVSGLKLSFILCREVPVLFQKVSRLLAVLYTISSYTAFPMLSSSISESQWASYFHQASLGTPLNHQFSCIGKQEDQKTTDVNDSFITSSGSRSWLRLAPESVLDLEEFISKFFRGLPCLTVICISMLGDDYSHLLRELFFNNPPTHACIMLSRLNSDSMPTVILLPINSILAGSSEDDSNLTSSNQKSCHKLWTCPWGHTIVDDVAPLFRMILEKHYMTSMAYPLEDTEKIDVEDLWFGPWKHMLLGECLDNKHLGSVQKRLMDDLKSECGVDVHESILKLITGCAGHVSCQEEWISELILNKGCYVGGTKRHDDCSKQEKLIRNAIREIGEENQVDRGPVILVLDFDIQMIPWENLPILRNQEVYRMPCVASISSTFDRCCQDQEKEKEKAGKDYASFPVIDPLDAYYLLNPDGDLPNAEATFKNWFKDHNLEGTAGTSPTVDELSVALKDHDLVIYFGHGSGVQYISGNAIQKLDGCAATLLMGCSSGSLSLNGPYTPKGAPLYYLSAGSPLIVANLWEVTDKDINRFGKALVGEWITRRSSSLENRMEISDKFNNMNIIIDGDKKRKGKRKISRKKCIESCEVNCSTLGCTSGSFMGEARQACILPFITGASPVCYGVPTYIKKKDLGTVLKTGPHQSSSSIT